MILPLLLALASPQHTAKPIVFGNATLYADSHALIVTVDEGKGSIAASRDDGKMVHDRLIQSFQYNPAGVKWLSGPDANEKQILTWFQGAKSFGPDDCVFIYFSMHATSDGNFLLYNDGSERKLQMAKVATLLQSIPSRHVVLIADTCYSGLIFDSFKSAIEPLAEGEAEKMVAGDCHYVVASSGKDQTSAYGAGGSRFTSQVAFALDDAARRKGPSKLAEVIQQVLDVGSIRADKAQIAHFVIGSKEIGEFLLVPKAQESASPESQSARDILEKILADYGQGRRIGLEEAADKALTLDKSFPVRRLASQVLLLATKFDKSIALAQGLLKEQPTDTASMSTLCSALLASGKAAEAEQFIDGWLKQNPRSVEGLAFQQTACAFQNKSDKAGAALQKAIELDPTLAQLRLAQIEASLVAGKTADATSQIKELVRVCGWTVNSWRTLLVDLDKLGRTSMILPIVRGSPALDSSPSLDAFMESTTLLSCGKFDEILDVPQAPAGERLLRALVSLHRGFACFALNKTAQMHAEIDRALSILSEPISEEEKARKAAEIGPVYAESVKRFHMLDPLQRQDVSQFKILQRGLWEPVERSLRIDRDLRVSRDAAAAKPLWLGQLPELALVDAQQVQFLLDVHMGDSVLEENWQASFPKTLSEGLQAFEGAADSSGQDSLQIMLVAPYAGAARDKALKMLGGQLAAGEATANALEGESYLVRQTYSLCARTVGHILLPPAIASYFGAKERQALAQVLQTQCTLRPDDWKLHVETARLLALDKSSALRRLQSVMVSRWPWMEGSLFLPKENSP